MHVVGRLRKNRFLAFSLPVAVCCILALTCVSSPLTQAQDRESDDQTSHVLYILSNDPAKNAVIAYNINSEDGSLSLLGTFPTGGTGQSNFDNKLGPDDNDNEVILSPGKKFLFAVNGGSNSIAVFRVHQDGKLTHVEGSPFSSHGFAPVSLGLAGDILVVLNGNDNNVQGVPPNGLPANYTTFKVRENGNLEHIPGEVDVPGNSNPVQVTMSPDGKVVFGMEFYAIPYVVPQIFPFLPPRGSVMESFTFNPDGSLQKSPSAPFVNPVNSRLVPSDPGTGYFLGMITHPTERIVYAGEAITNRLVTYTYDSQGLMTFVTDSPSQGLATCWIAMGKGAKFLYTSDAASNQIGVWDISNPLSPINVQEVSLRIVGNPPQALPPAEFATVDFQLSVDPTGRFLYVTNHALADTDYPGGNVIHILAIQSDGRVAEADFSPVLIPVPGNVHPMGNATR